MEEQFIFNNVEELETTRNNLRLHSDFLFPHYLNELYINLLSREKDSEQNKSNLDKTALSKDKLNESKENIDNISDDDLSKNDKKNTGKSNSMNTFKTTVLKKEHSSYMSFYVFCQYINLQTFISERIFKFLSKTKSGKITKNEFSAGLNLIYYGKLKDIIEFSFDLCDFDNDKKIHKDDMKLILNYIPFKGKFKQQDKIDFISDVIDNFFEDLEVEFPEIYEQRKSDKNKILITFEIFSNKIEEFIQSYPKSSFKDNQKSKYHRNGAFFYFIYLMSYLYINLPFIPGSVEAYKFSKKKFLMKLSTKKVNIFGNRSESVKQILTTAKKKTSTNSAAVDKIDKNALFSSAGKVERGPRKLTVLRGKSLGKERLDEIDRQNLFKNKKCSSTADIHNNNENTKNLNITVGPKGENINNIFNAMKKRHDEVKRDYIVAKKIEKDIINKSNRLTPLLPPRKASEKIVLKAMNKRIEKDSERSGDRSPEQNSDRLSEKFSEKEEYFSNYDKNSDKNLDKTPLQKLKDFESRKDSTGVFKLKKRSMDCSFSKQIAVHKVSSTNLGKNTTDKKIKLSPIQAKLDIKKGAQTLPQKIKEATEYPPEFHLVDNEDSNSNSKKQSPSPFHKKRLSSDINEFVLEAEEENETTLVNNYETNYISNYLFDHFNKMQKCEDYLFKYSEEEKIKVFKRYYAALNGNEILFYSSNMKNELNTLWYVKNSFIKTYGKVNINNVHYYSIEIKYNNDHTDYLYFEESDKCNNFYKILKKSIGFELFQDHYTINEKIGCGHFATVFKCTENSTNKIYAVKIIDKKLLKDKDLSLILNEKSYLKLFKHPSISSLIDDYEDENKIYFVMDLYSGGDLITFIENQEKNKKQISEKTAAKIIRKIGQGIQFMKYFGVIHRDLKPENIIFGKSEDLNSLKIIDLGISKTLTYGEFAHEPLGTIAYIAPEIFEQKPYNHKADVWAIGVILYLLITNGVLPFDDENLNEDVIGKKVVFTQQEYPDELFGKKSKSLLNLIDRCLEKEQEKRISIDEFLKDSWIINNSH